MSEWKKTNNYYNRDVITSDVWSYQITKKRTIYLIDDPESNFTYTFSCGANSDYSFTNCFFQTTIKTLDDAKDYLVKFADAWLADNRKEYRRLKQSIELDTTQ